MRKIRTFKSPEFAHTKDDAIQYFLHYAHDHMIASRYLAQTILLDSSAYLCNVAIELLLKAMHLYENGFHNHIGSFLKFEKLFINFSTAFALYSGVVC